MQLLKMQIYNNTYHNLKKKFIIAHTTFTNNKGTWLWVVNTYNPILGNVHYPYQMKTVDFAFCIDASVAQNLLQPFYLLYLLLNMYIQTKIKLKIQICLIKAEVIKYSRSSIFFLINSPHLKVVLSLEYFLAELFPRKLRWKTLRSMSDYFYVSEKIFLSMPVYQQDLALY